MLKKNQPLTQEAFDKLLAWLNPDRDAAGQKYEAIRSKLIKYFLSKGSIEPEDLTDETINRVAQNIDEIAGKYEGTPEAYFLAVARKVCMVWYLPRKEAA
jgi:DNA-directed RNA polymerase specialized sigma24 family protein